MCITLSLLTDNVKCTSNAQTDHNTEVKAKLCHPIGTFAIPCKYQQDLWIKPVEWTTTLSTHMDVQQTPRWLKQLGRKPAVTRLNHTNTRYSWRKSLLDSTSTSTMQQHPCAILNIQIIQSLKTHSIT
jgi:hypothetical protein